MKATKMVKSSKNDINTGVMYFLLYGLRPDSCAPMQSNFSAR